MNIFEGDKYLGCVPYRPIAMGAIIRYNGVTYDLRERHDAYIVLKRRIGAFGQAATPDYILDEPDPTFPRKFRVCYNTTDTYLGEVTLNKMPITGLVIRIKRKSYQVVDWSIGQRRIDELYVKGV